MTSDRFQSALNLLGQATAPSVSPVVSPAQPGDLVGPHLEVQWGAFRQGIGSSLRALFARAAASTDGPAGTAFKDCWVERRVPRRALVAAALWHVVFFAMPFPQLLLSAHKKPAFRDFELTWSGPVNDLPLVEIPRQRAKPSPRGEPNKPLTPQGADAFHPRQRIFTDPVHPTHARQTLINPAAPFEPPKFLPNLPNMVELQRAAAPTRPRLQISEATLKKLRPRQRRVARVTSAPLPDVPNMEQRAADVSLVATRNAPARPKLELNAGAAPRVAPRAQTGDAGPAPEVGATQLSAANGSAAALIALSATPAPPAPVVQPPQGNLAARISISPEGTQRGVPGGAPNATPEATGAAGASGSSGGSGSGDGAGKSSIGVSISGGNPATGNGVSGLGGAAKISRPSVRALITRPDPRVSIDDVPGRIGPPNFATLPAGAKPEQIFASKRVYTLNVNMPNLNSATGSWILNFSELRSNPDGPRIVSSDLTGPSPLKKVDPKYPPSLVSDRVEGEVVLYAVIRRNGSVDSIQLVHGIDEQLDANAMDALGQWKFRPAAKGGTPVELEAIVHIPFRVPATY
jgi:TonB family protein